MHAMMRKEGQNDEKGERYSVRCGICLHLTSGDEPVNCIIRFVKITRRVVESNLVAKWLGGDEGDFLDDPLVGVEVKGQLGVVLLNDHPGRLLHSLGPHTSHPGRLVLLKQGLKLWSSLY